MVAVVVGDARIASICPDQPRCIGLDFCEFDSQAAIGIGLRNDPLSRGRHQKLLRRRIQANACVTLQATRTGDDLAGEFESERP